MKGLELRALRKKFGLSRIKFAEFINISVHTLDSWEGGKRNIPDTKADLIKLKLRELSKSGYGNSNNDGQDVSVVEEEASLYGMEFNQKEKTLDNDLAKEVKVLERLSNGQDARIQLLEARIEKLETKFDSK